MALVGYRIASLWIATIALCAAAEPAAQGYPARPVRIVTGGVGTFHDIVTRQLGQRLSERWGQPVVVENQGAAALTVGTGMVARAAPDGYTLVMSDRSALTVAPHLYKSVPYDPARDFAPVTLVAAATTMLVAHPSVPANNLQELVAWAKRAPDVAFATAGPGTNNHVAMELFRAATGVNAIPVHYKGGGASTAALLGGEVQVGFGAMPSAWPHVQAGRLKAYLVTSRERFPAAPEVPTAREAGVPDLELEFWIGLLAPAGTPSPIIAKINHDVGDILRTPGMQEILRAQGARGAAGSAEQFAEHVRAESAKMKRLIASTDMRAE